MSGARGAGGGGSVTVEDARRLYAIHASELRMATVAHGRQRWLHRPQERCVSCQTVALACDAASIDLDLAVAQESEERTRRSVAWG